MDQLTGQNVEVDDRSAMNSDFGCQQLWMEMPANSVRNGGADQSSNVLPDLQIADARVIRLPREEPKPGDPNLWADTTKGVAPGAMRGPSRETGAPVREI